MTQAKANGASAATASTSVLSPAPAQLPRSSEPASNSTTTEHAIEYKLSHPSPQPSNRYSRLIAHQEIATVDHFELENGDVLQDVQVAYKTWGKLNDKRDNCMVICHALTGSADVEDWCALPNPVGNSFQLTPYDSQVGSHDGPRTCFRSFTIFYSMLQRTRLSLRQLIACHYQSFYRSAVGSRISACNRA